MCSSSQTPQLMKVAPLEEEGAINPTAIDGRSKHASLVPGCLVHNGPYNNASSPPVCILSRLVATIPVEGLAWRRWRVCHFISSSVAHILGMAV